MQYSGKPPRPSGKIKNRNNNQQQIAHPYNGNLNFLSSAPTNVSSINTGQQLHINGKYVNNVANVNEVSVLQYRRTTTNMQIKNNLEMNRFQNLKYQQQQQAFMYKNAQYNNQMNPNLTQKYPVNRPLMHRKNVADQVRGVAGFVPPQPFKKVEFLNKRSKDLRYPHDSNNFNNRNVLKPHLLREQAAVNVNTNLIRQTNTQVPEKIVKCSGDDKENEKTEIEEVIDKILNSGTEQSSNEEHNDGDSNKSSKTAREKTPMCLINDLARFNKIAFQYRLTSENGPAHCKRFTVTLILGDEEYTAEGLKIKEAQHLAAKEAIEKTKYKHPAPKVTRRSDDETVKPNITPTVELNALAMKLGQQTYYVIDHQQIEGNFNYKTMNQPFDGNQGFVQQQQATAIPNDQILNNQRRPNLPRYHQNRFVPFQHMLQSGPIPSAYALYSPACPTKVTLKVGTNKFVGVGRTLQLAKHDAASNALKVIKGQLEKEQMEVQNESIEENDNKSPISLVFEIGIKRNLPVDFKVIREEGPAHMRTFVTACIVGDIMTEGEGAGKKISKKKAAHKMLEELKKLPPLSPAVTPVKRTKLKTSFKKSRDQSKDNTTATAGATKDVEKPSSHQRSKRIPAETEPTNPINKLIEWHQNRKEKEPEFKVINEGGQENSRRKEFVVEVASNNIVVRGVGINKRLAKQHAAQKFLNAVSETTEQTETIATTTPTLGTENSSRKSNVNKKNRTDTSIKMASSRNFNKQEPHKKIPTKETESKKSAATEKNEKIEEDEEEENAKYKNRETQNKENITDKKTQNKENCNSSIKNTEPSILAKQEINETVTSSNEATTALSSKESNTTTQTNSHKTPNLYMKDQLLYLAKLLDFEVSFCDYPKGNHKEFLSVVMLSTTPSQICHGVGQNANESQEDAAKNALKILSEMGLNNVVKST